MTQAAAFADVRVLDFTHYIAGPFATFQLAMQGADVIKIEPRSGDLMRTAPASPPWAERGMSPAWMAVNAGKRSLALDVTKPAGVAVVRRLVRDADVVVENFRPGVMDRLGIGYEQLREVNPRLIYCAISGFGASGPDSDTPCFDGKIQAMSGLMSLTGDPQSGPMRAGFPLADATAGLMSSFAIATALYQRATTGEGQFVDVSMLDSMMTMLAGVVCDYTTAGITRRQIGNRSIGNLPTSDRFACGDGYIVLAAVTPKQFASLMTVLDRADVVSDPRFRDLHGQIENAAALHDIIATALAKSDPATLEARLTAAGVPCGMVLGVADIVAHPQVGHRGLLQEVETPFGPVKLVGSAFRLSDRNHGIPGSAARLGEHTESILKAAEYDDGAIDRLREAAII